MTRDFQDAFKILTAANAVKGAASNGNGTPMDVAAFRHLVLAIDTAGTATLTVNVQGSISETAPDFTAAASVSNQWSYIQVVDYLDRSAVNGGGNIAASGSDIHRLFEVNTNGLKWLNVIVTAYTGGSVTALCKVFND